MARFVLNAVGDAFKHTIAELEKPMARAATAAMKQAAELAKAKGRASIAAGGFSKKWQNALRANVYPATGASLKPAALVFHKISYSSVFEEGATIAGKPLLWIPLANVPSSSRGSGHPMTPSEYAARFGPLVSVNVPGKPPMLFAQYAPKGPRRRRARRPNNRVPLFIGVPLVDIAKRFDVTGACQEAAAALPALYQSNLQV